MRATTGGSKSFLALLCLYVATLMATIDATIVAVALPSMAAHFQISNASVAWLVSAYTLTFGGFLITIGRAADVYGIRRLFLAGILLFTCASLACGFSWGLGSLLIARAVQGLGTAAITATALALMMRLVQEPQARATVFGLYGVICAAGGALGDLVGGVLTELFGWKWIFLINVPLGAMVLVVATATLAGDSAQRGSRHINFSGAALFTAAMMLITFGAIQAGNSGQLQPQVWIAVVGSAALMLAFRKVEFRAPLPLLPAHLFKTRNLVSANITAVLWSAGIFAWFIIVALYLQRVLHYRPLYVGLAYLPAEIIMIAFSGGLSAKLAVTYGVRRMAVIGLVLAAAGLALFAHCPVGGQFVADVLPGMLVVGIGNGLGLTPLLLMATNDVEPSDSGVASGIINASFAIGGSLGLAALATLAHIRTTNLLKDGDSPLIALNGGYHLAFLFGALLIAAGAGLGARISRSEYRKPAELPVN